MARAAEVVQLDRAEPPRIQERRRVPGLDVFSAGSMARFTMNAGLGGLNPMGARVDCERAGRMAAKTFQRGRFGIESAIQDVLRIRTARRESHALGRRIVAHTVLDVGVLTRLAHPGDRLQTGAESPLAWAALRSAHQGSGMARLGLRFELLCMTTPARLASYVGRALGRRARRGQDRQQK